MVPPTTSRVEIEDKKRCPFVHESGLVEDVCGRKRRKTEYVTTSDGAVKEDESSSNATAGFSSQERETDPHRIRQRLKQVEYGKNTVGKRRILRLKKDFHCAIDRELTYHTQAMIATRDCCIERNVAS